MHRTVNKKKNIQIIYLNLWEYRTTTYDSQTNKQERNVKYKIGVQLISMLVRKLSFDWIRWEPKPNTHE